MSKKTRLIILFSCVVCFFVIAPILVAYSMGYRLDLEKKEIVGTGGIYVRTFPPAEQVIVDSKISAKPGIFSNAIFVQSLLAKEHTVFVAKEGYHDYFKTLSVIEKEVTKLENVTLFKEDIKFTDIADSVAFFSISPDNNKIIASSTNINPLTLNYFNINDPLQVQIIPIKESAAVLDIKWSSNSDYALIKMQDSKEVFYYLFNNASKIPSTNRLSYLDKNSQQINFNPINISELFYVENNTLYILKNNKPSALIKDLLLYTISENNILWLSTDGALKKSDTSGKIMTVLLAENITVSPEVNYNLIFDSDKIFLDDGDSLSLYNASSKTFTKLNIPKGSFKIIYSPDGKNLILWDSSKIYLYSPVSEKYEELFSGFKITNCQWINNDYIVITSENSVILSEIDFRGEINQITLPMETASPKTFYIGHSGKLYILTNNTLSESEKLTP